MCHAVSANMLCSVKPETVWHKTVFDMSNSFVGVLELYSGSTAKDTGTEVTVAYLLHILPVMLLKLYWSFSIDDDHRIPALIYVYAF